jgi:hypothetical protein
MQMETKREYEMRQSFLGEKSGSSAGLQFYDARRPIA